MEIHTPFHAASMQIHEARMRLALRQARRAAEAGEVPVGAVVYSGGELAGQAWNQTRTLKDPTAHAEMIAITQAAAAAGDWRLVDSILYVTKEPCPMCAGAIVLARIPLVVWGATDPLRGGAVSRFQILQTPELNHRAHVLPGVLEQECAALLKSFFKDRREQAKEPQDPL
jgi:tRNA(adenine34) deaminase